MRISDNVSAPCPLYFPEALEIRYKESHIGLTEILCYFHSIILFYLNI